MNEKDAEEIMHIPFAQLAQFCEDPRILTLVVKTAYSQGIKLGLETAHKAYNELFNGYNEVSITN